MHTMKHLALKGVTKMHVLYLHFKKFLLGEHPDPQRGRENPLPSVDPTIYNRFTSLVYIQVMSRGRPITCDAWAAVL